MRSTPLLAIFVLAACGGDGGSTTPDAPGGIGEPAELVGITLAHNEARSKVGVGPMTWDPALATIASKWAAMCQDTDGNGLLDHNAGRSEGYPTYVGENIYASTGTANGTGAVKSWVSESVDYDYDANTCASGKICGHYTQVVWRASVKLGCALHSCPGLKYASTIVCDYGPGGNSGGKPY
jgi:hypothetical protein